MAVELALAPPPLETTLTGDELLAPGDIGPNELVEGRVILMSPTGDAHGGYESNFDFHVSDFVWQHKLGKVRVGEVGIYTHRHPDTVRGVDLAFISHERFAKRKRQSGFLDVAPDLIVEIMSPDDRWSEVMQKLREYFTIGVRLMWVAAPHTRTVYAYRSLTDVREFNETDTLPGDDVLPGFSLPVAQVFEE